MKFIITAAFLTSVTYSVAALAAGGGAAPIAPAVSSDQHFHPKGKMPSEHTLKILEAARKELPFSDTRDFEEDEKGSIEVGKLADLVILSDDPTAVDPEALDTIRVTETIKEGQTVFELE